MKHIGFGAGWVLLEMKKEFVRGLSYLVDNDGRKQGKKVQ